MSQSLNLLTCFSSPFHSFLRFPLLFHLIASFSSIQCVSPLHSLLLNVPTTYPTSNFFYHSHTSYLLAIFLMSLLPLYCFFKYPDTHGVCACICTSLKRATSFSTLILFTFFCLLLVLLFSLSHTYLWISHLLVGLSCFSLISIPLKHSPRIIFSLLSLLFSLP